VIRITLALLGALILISSTAMAQEMHVEGYADFRFLSAGPPDSFLDGGVGKLRFGQGEGDQAQQFQFAEASMAATLLLTGDVLAYANIRYDSRQRTALDALEAYARYRPVSVSRWRWSVKAGAFFPPISLENTGIGWTIPWTLTPSAINSWVGEELRTIGSEAKIEWRGDVDRMEWIFALYGLDDPAGALLAARGWSLNDRITGLFDLNRLPNATEYNPSARRIHPFREIDDRPGWYSGVRWRSEGIGSLELLRYDNQANPSARRDGQLAWRTSFWSLGAETGYDDFVLISQAMFGETEIDPTPQFNAITKFQSAYLLAGYDLTDWRLAARVDGYAAQQQNAGRNVPAGEHGDAVTLALTWLPIEALRVTAEGIRNNSWRLQRTVVEEPPRAVETVFQLGVRVFF